ncbi:hypothetical protein [Undibacterium sp. WLHG33]
MKNYSFRIPACTGSGTTAHAWHLMQQADGLIFSSIVKADYAMS